MEGFLMAFIITSIEDPEILLGFFITFIGTRSLSIPADVFILANSKRDPIFHNLKVEMLEAGLGHVLVKQMALMQLVVGGAILIAGSTMVGMMDRYAGLSTILLSPFGIVGLQLIFIFSKKKEREHLWSLKYLIGIALYSILSFSFLDLGGGFGMLAVINILFLSASDFWTKGRISPQVTKYQVEELKALPWGYYSISQGGVLAGFISGLLIGCPTSTAAECCVNRFTRKEEKLHIHTTAQATSDALNLLLWMFFGYSRSSYADSMGKAGLSLELSSSSIFLFAVSIISLSIVCLLFIEEWSYIYLSTMRLIGKLINLICCIITVALCVTIVGFVPVLLGLVGAQCLSLLKLPEESKLGVMGAIPLISINWLSFI